MTQDGVHEHERWSMLRELRQSTSSRREFLARAMAAGLIPILSGGTGHSSALAAEMQENSPVQGGTFITLGHQEVAGLSPEQDGPTVQWVAITQMFNGMYELNYNLELVPVLAESYEASEDGLTYTFRLRQGVKFHNGDEFTSADVKYSFDWVMDPKNGSTRSGAMELVESVEAPDDYTVVVTLNAPDVTFMIGGAGLYIYPSKYHKEIGEEEFSAKPVGTGPFKLKEWNAQQRTVLEAFDDHFRNRPHFDEFRLDVVPEAGGRLAALESGQADNSIWQLNAEDNARLIDSGDFTVFETVQNAINHFPLNNEHPILSDKNVRKALMHAMDREAIINDIFQGQATLATSNLSPKHEKYYNPDVVKYDYNVDTANKLLDDAGWTMGGDGIREKDGKKLSFTCVTITGDSNRRPEAEIAQQWFKDVGVDMKLQEATVDIILKAMTDGKMDASLFNWVYGGGGGDPDARSTLSSDGANNFSNFKNKRVDELLLQGIKEQDQEARVAIYKEVQAIVAEEVPFLFILVFNNYAFYGKSIKGLPDKVLESDNIYPFVFELWRAKE